MWLVLWGLAHGAECDSASLSNEVNNASPVAIARAYIALAECDMNSAKRAAPGAFGRMLSSKEANEAAIHGLNAGAHEAVDRWLEGLDRGEKTGAIRALGAQCKHEAVADFLVDIPTRKGEAFWTDRWYRGLADCRTPAIQALLTNSLADPSLSERDNRSRFFGLLEVYARNLGEGAIPELERLATNLKDQQERAIVVRAYGDAVQVGGNGTDTAADPKSATESLLRVAPALKPSTLPTLRETLVAIGATNEAESVAVFRWPERQHAGLYTYVATATEAVTCKNGKTHHVFHYGDVREPGAIWPDTMSEQLSGMLANQWSFEAASKCKGIAEIVYAMTPEPVKGEESAKQWLDDQRAKFLETSANANKQSESAEEPIVWGT